MTSHYRLPVLLIEFDHDKAFALQASLAFALSQQHRLCMMRIEETSQPRCCHAVTKRLNLLGCCLDLVLLFKPVCHRA